MTFPDLQAAIADFDARLSSDTAPGSAWLGLQILSERLIGAKLFTIMTVDMKNEVARREYTSDPVAYPVSGTKPIHYDRWFEIVHKERQMFVANTIADISTVFPDFETIRSLGCGSVINLPIIIGDELVATVNLLHEENHYTPERVGDTAHLSLPAKAAFLAEAFVRR
jgi:hypothetical protein